MAHASLAPLSALALLAGCAVAPTAPTPPAPPLQFHGTATTTVTLLAGARDLSSDFDPASRPGVFGVDVEVHDLYGVAGFEAGYQHASGSGTSTVAGAGELRAQTRMDELSAGSRWTFAPWFDGVRPYVGVGLAALRGQYEVSGLGGSNVDTGWALGVYGHAGLVWDLSQRLRAALDLRALLSSEASLQQRTTLDYLQLAFGLGWAW